jgi:transposase
MFKTVYDSNTIRRAIQLYQEKKSFRKVANVLKVSKSTVHRWWCSFSKFVLPSSRVKKKKSRRTEKYPLICERIKSLFEI